MVINVNFKSKPMLKNADITKNIRQLLYADSAIDTEGTITI